MQYLPFVALIVLPIWVDWSAAQAVVFSSVLLLLLGWRKRGVLSVTPAYVALLLWPVYLFATMPAQQEYMSENMLRVSSMGMFGFMIMNVDWIKLTQLKYCGLIVASLGILFQFTACFFDLKPFDLRSFYPQENAFQYINLISLFGAISVFVNARESLTLRVLSFVLFILLAFSIAIGDSFSNGAFSISGGDPLAVWISAFVAIIVYALLGVKCPLSIKRAALFTVNMLIAVMPIVVVVMLGDANFANTSISSRIVFWQASLSALAHNPFFGVGFGWFGSIIKDYWPDLNHAIYHVSVFPIAAHNQVLHIAVENGLIGLIWWLFMWLFAIDRLTVLLSKVYDIQVRLLITLLVTAFCAMSLMEVTQMFFVCQLATWAILVASLKRTLDGESRKEYVTPKWLLVVVALLLIVPIQDRIRQLVSFHMTYDLERTGTLKTSEFNVLSEALSWHQRNTSALYYSAELSRITGDHQRSLAIIQQLEEQSGSRWPIHRMKVENYIQTGQMDRACVWAEWPINKSIDKRDQNLRNLLKCD